MRESTPGYVYDKPCFHVSDIIFYSGYKHAMRYCQKCGNIWYSDEETEEETKKLGILNELKSE